MKYTVSFVPTSSEFYLLFGQLDNDLPWNCAFSQSLIVELILCCAMQMRMESSSNSSQAEISFNNYFCVSSEWYDVVPPAQHWFQPFPIHRISLPMVGHSCSMTRLWWFCRTLRVHTMSSAFVHVELADQQHHCLTVLNSTTFWILSRNSTKTKSFAIPAVWVH